MREERWCENVILIYFKETSLKLTVCSLYREVVSTQVVLLTNKAMFKNTDKTRLVLILVIAP